MAACDVGVDYRIEMDTSLKRRLKSVSVLLILQGGLACNTSTSQPQSPQPDIPPAPVVATPASDWTVLKPQVDRMDGTVLQFVTTGTGVTLDMCFENGRPCKTPVSIGAPKGCYIEGNFEDWNTRRKVRVKFDEEKARSEPWIIADSHDALIPIQPSAFIAELHKHKTLLFEFGCAKYDQGEVIDFHINGLQQALDSMKNANENK